MPRAKAKAKPAGTTGTYACEMHGMQFKSATALAQHRRWRHGENAVPRRGAGIARKANTIEPVDPIAALRALREGLPRAIEQAEQRLTVLDRERQQINEELARFRGIMDRPAERTHTAGGAGFGS